MSATTSGMSAERARRDQTFMATIGRRQLDYYPDTGMRVLQLALVVLVTVILYYENYVGGGVGPQVLANLHMSFTYYVTGLAFANLAGAFASIAAGLADRFGRANLVVYGVLITGVIMLFALPNAHSPGVWWLRPPWCATSRHRSAGPPPWASGPWARYSAAWW
jgi:MFS family permease